MGTTPALGSGLRVNAGSSADPRLSKDGMRFQLGVDIHNLTRDTADRIDNKRVKFEVGGALAGFLGLGVGMMQVPRLWINEFPRGKPSDFLMMVGLGTVGAIVGVYPGNALGARAADSVIGDDISRIEKNAAKQKTALTTQLTELGGPLPQETFDKFLGQLLESGVNPYDTGSRPKIYLA